MIKKSVITQNIGIIGLGFVGGAIMMSLIDNEFIVGKNLFIYDKYKDGGIGSITSILSANIVFLALPTKYDATLRQFNKDAIHSVCSLLEKLKFKGCVVVKSTVEPTTTQKFADNYNLNIIHNPEFLSAATAYKDFHNQKHIILGKTSQCKENAYNSIKQFYLNYYPNADISECTSTESESVKIFANTFYSVKIQYFNEMYLMCEKLGIEYDKIRDMLLKNGWINKQHTYVPGPDGKLSYGGLCFPKDTNALLKFMEVHNVPRAVVESTIKERNIMRNDHNNCI